MDLTSAVADFRIITTGDGRRYGIGRLTMAACLGALVCAPGCALGTVFLLRNDAAVAAMALPPEFPVITKSDRLPREQWSREAAAIIAPTDDVRIAQVAISDEHDLLTPVALRGSFNDPVAVVDVIEPAVAVPAQRDQPFPAPQKQRLKRQVRQPQPMVVAEALPTAPPDPTLFEKLFGPLFH